VRHTAQSIVLQNNNFDLLRFLFAFIVFLVHAYALSGEYELLFLNQWLSSEIAVQSFFIVSGFLIFMSYENSSTSLRYFEKRARRILPAYISVIVLVVVAGFFLTTLPWHEYLSIQTFKYLAANLMFMNFLQPELPGLFADNRLQAVNGALWTLKIEVMFYLSVPVLVWSMGRWGRWQVLLLTYVMSLCYVQMLGWWGEREGVEHYRELQRQLPGQLSWFIAGATLYYYLGSFKRWWPGLLIVALLLLFFRSHSDLSWLEPAALAMVVIYAACLLPGLGRFGKFGDFSYGIYIVHFPILQVLIAAGLFAWSPVLGLFTAGILVLTAAILFWHGIEKPFLRRSSHYVEVNRE